MIRIDEIWLSTQPMDMRAGMDTAMAQVVRAFGYIKPHCAYLFVQHRDLPLELRRSDREADGRRRGDDVAGARIDHREVPRAGIHQQVGDAPEAIGCGQLLQLMDQFLQLGALRRGDRQLGRRGAQDEPLHRVRLAAGGELGAFLGRVRAQAVETASRIGLDLHLDAFVGHLGNERLVEHRELGPPRLDDDGLVGGGDDLALERLGIDVEAQRRNLGLAVEDVELEAADVGRHVAANQRRHLCADGLGIHWETPCGNPRNSRPQGRCVPWG